MSGVNITIHVNDAEASKALARAAEHAADLRPLMEQVGAALLLSTQMRFEAEKGPDGNPWPQSLRAKLQGGKTLRDTNQLYQSLTFNATSSEVEVGSNKIYSAIHQFGGTIKAKNKKVLRFRIGNRWISKKQVTIPPRPFLGVDAADRTEIEATVSDWIGSAIQ